ncbi:MAG: hypothetical protein IT350_19255 [Deltaproteobacteria bacterium]|nr:hypothetical protein [Deltaproteobacteria bacterium]
MKIPSRGRLAMVLFVAVIAFAFTAAPAFAQPADTPDVPTEPTPVPTVSPSKEATIDAAKAAGIVPLAPPASADAPGVTPAPPGPKLDPLPVVANGKIDRPSCSVGQRVTYEIALSWISAPGRVVRVAPFDAPQTAGLDVIQQHQRTAKSIVGDEIHASITTFIDYRCASAGEFKIGPVTVAYDDGSGQNLSTVAPAVTVNIRPTLLGLVRSSAYTKYGFFAAGLAVFWIIVLLVRRARRRRRAEPQAAEPAPEHDASWASLENEAREPTAEFYERLEERLWTDLFAPDPVPSGSAAVRFAELSAGGVSRPVLDLVREALTYCQRGRQPNSGLGQGDAIEALRVTQNALRARRELETETSRNSDATAR